MSDQGRPAAPDSGAAQHREPELARLQAELDLALRELRVRTQRLNRLEDELQSIRATLGWRALSRLRTLAPAKSRRGRMIRGAVRTLGPARWQPGGRPIPDRTRAGPDGAVTAARPHDRVRVLIVCPMPVTRHVAGPALRSWGFARVLADSCDVTVLVPNEDHPAGDAFAVKCHRGDAKLARSVMRDHDVLLFQGFILRQLPGIADEARFVVADVLDPFNLEDFHSRAAEPLGARMRLNDFEVAVLKEQLQLADFVLCGNERQRDFWLGLLNAAQRINPLNSDADPTFRRLIDVVPFGVRDEAPIHTRQVAKGVHPRIAATDKLVLWGGGMWQWFDPLTPIRAMARVVKERPDAKLLFLGVVSPDPGTPRMPILDDAIGLAAELGLHDRHVLFGDWVPYTDIQNYLLEADVGLSFHGDHLETYFSIRTRLFDYMWARLPMVLSRGDNLGDELSNAGVATTVDFGDDVALAEALLAMLALENPRAHYRERFAPLLAKYSWQRVTEPLVRYCSDPWRAADRALLPPLGDRLMLSS